VNSTHVLVNNTFAIKLAKNLKFHDQTKHINTKYHLMSKLRTFSSKHMEEKNLKSWTRNPWDCVIVTLM
jgi:hypothetical protein